MAQVTISEINTALTQTLGAAVGIIRAQDAGELSEGIPPDLPLLQVYWQRLAAEGQSDRQTFRVGVRGTRLTYHCDMYARQRSHLGEDMAKVLEIAEAVLGVLEAQQSAPLFGLEGIQSLHWTAERVTFEYAGGSYAGVRFVIEIGVF